VCAPIRTHDDSFVPFKRILALDMCWKEKKNDDAARVEERRAAVKRRKKRESERKM
jgi:hypothetical protein